MKVGFFIPSSYEDYNYLESILDKGLDRLSLIVSNGSGKSLPERYAQARGVNYRVYPISKHQNVFISNRLVIGDSDRVVIFDNGASSNVSNVIEECDLANRPYKVIKVEKPETVSKTIKREVDKLREIYRLFLEAEEEAPYPIDMRLLLGDEKLAEKLEKVLKKIYDTKK